VISDAHKACFGAYVRPESCYVEQNMTQYNGVFDHEVYCIWNNFEVHYWTKSEPPEGSLEIRSSYDEFHPIVEIELNNGTCTIKREPSGCPDGIPWVNELGITDWGKSGQGLAGAEAGIYCTNLSNALRCFKNAQECDALVQREGYCIDGCASGWSTTATIPLSWNGTQRALMDDLLFVDKCALSYADSFYRQSLCWIVNKTVKVSAEGSGAMIINVLAANGTIIGRVRMLPNGTIAEKWGVMPKSPYDPGQDNSSSAGPSDRSEELRRGQIVGIVVGTAAVMGALAVVAVVVILRHRRRAGHELLVEQSDECAQ
jgi:hypothetical protein